MCCVVVDHRVQVFLSANLSQAPEGHFWTYFSNCGRLLVSPVFASRTNNLPPPKDGRKMLPQLDSNQ